MFVPCAYPPLMWRQNRVEKLLVQDQASFHTVGDPFDGDGGNAPVLRGVVFPPFRLEDDEVRDLFRKVSGVKAAVGFDLVGNLLALVGVFKTGHAAEKLPTSRLGPVRGWFSSARLERAHLPLLFERQEVDLDIFYPKITDSLDPSGDHDPDVRPFFRNMAVFGGVVIADDQVGAVGGQVIFVLAAELGCLGCDV